jgi:hypothetical protein
MTALELLSHVSVLVVDWLQNFQHPFNLKPPDYLYNRYNRLAAASGGKTHHQLPVPCVIPALYDILTRDIVNQGIHDSFHISVLFFA